jgi:hypothetical protein
MSNWAMRAAATLATVAIALGSVAVTRADRPATRTKVQACPGKFRWPVKTLSDRRANGVNYTPASRTVVELRRIRRPSIAIRADTPRLPGVERKTYAVRGRLVRVRRELDGDFHLVIRGLRSTGTMVTELPDPNCDGAARSRKRAEMAAARSAFLDACGPVTRYWRTLDGTATVVGAGFFDSVHRSIGQAPNYLELHPLLSFIGVCGRPPPPPPPPVPRP